MTPVHYRMRSIQRFIFLLTFCLETPKAGSGPTSFWKVTSLASLLAISFLHTPEYPGTQNSPILCQVETSFNAFWHCCTNGDVILAAWRAFRATWLSHQMQTYFLDLAFICISWEWAKIAYISAWKTVAYFPRKMLSLLPKHCSQTLEPIPPCVQYPSVPDKPFNWRSRRSFVVQFMLV